MGRCNDLERNAAFLQPVGDLHRNVFKQLIQIIIRIIELHDAGIHGREIENIVDDGQENRGGGGNMVEIFRLPVRQLADAGCLQEVGETDDIRQRRAQLVGNMLHEIVLQLVGLQKRVVLFLERPLGPHAVGHVDEGQHGL
ncbi:hypothetical protein D3C86_1203660 [compost metagenome]